MSAGRHRANARSAPGWPSRSRVQIAASVAACGGRRSSLSFCTTGLPCEVDVRCSRSVLTAALVPHAAPSICMHAAPAGTLLQGVPEGSFWVPRIESDHHQHVCERGILANDGSQRLPSLARRRSRYGTRTCSPDRRLPLVRRRFRVRTPQATTTETCRIDLSRADANDRASWRPDVPARRTRYACAQLTLRLSCRLRSRMADASRAARFERPARSLAWTTWTTSGRKAQSSSDRKSAPP